ncbi:hypothetical protein [Mucilaginibacter flavus]|uniref:hypothetical protein n=1 Tax=Mucilaginibacter flavus TaxID=931504 RepID=UPI0025B3106B|nr:hypothetical protein [Mucilaginibacter flavus]MDN3582067.1 hypothetical protein [Mucilaginibacter flavus]
MTFTLSLKKMLKPLLRLGIVVTIIIAVGFYYAGGYDSSLLPGFIIIICIPSIPTIYLLIEYYIATKNQIFEIVDNTFSIKKRGSLYTYNFSDIKTIKLFKSAGMEKGNFPYQTAEMYYHAEILTSDGKKTILTSIIDPDIETALSMFSGVNYEVKRTIYSTIYI